MLEGYMSRLKRPSLAFMFLVFGVLTLSWFDVLPGGWTLRGWMKPHHIRKAEKQEEYSESRLALFAPENKTAPEGATVWLGSSTIERFRPEEHFEGDHLNRGIGAESAGELGARLGRSLPEATPSRFVFYIGSIDFRNLKRAPDHIADNANGIVTTALATYPEADIEVFVLGILPEQNMTGRSVSRLRKTNIELSKLCTQSEWTFVATHKKPIALEDGSLDPEYAADRLHLNERGYEQLVDWLTEKGF